MKHKRYFHFIIPEQWDGNCTSAICAEVTTAFFKMYNKLPNWLPEQGPRIDKGDSFPKYENDKTKCKYIVTSPNEQKEALVWIYENCKGNWCRYYTGRGTVYAFTDEEDAFLFKLVFV